MNRIFRYTTIASLLITYTQTYAQANVGIGTTSPNQYAILDIKSADGKKGLSIPIMNYNDRQSIVGGAPEGLLVYDKGLNQFVFFDGSVWRSVNQLSQTTVDSNVPVALPSTHNGNLSVVGGLSSTSLSTGNISSSGTISAGAVNTSGTVNANMINASNYALNNTSGNGPIPKGGIIMWTGSVVPDGWLLCDGTFPTPDLRDRFVMGAGYYGMGVYAGSSTVTLTKSNLPRHVHSYQEFQLMRTDWDGGHDERDNGTGANAVRGTGDGSPDGLNSTPFSILPPFYALAFIMKK